MATKPRTRKRKAVETTAADETPATGLTPQSEPTAEQASLVTDNAAKQDGLADDKNVSPLEGLISVYAGGLLIAFALFPRTLKQILLLGVGAGFLYRGRSRHCHTYAALGIDTNR